MSTEEPKVDQGTEEIEVENPEAEEATQESAQEAKAPVQDLRDMRISMLERALQEKEATLHAYIRAHKKAEQEFEDFKKRQERERARELESAKAKLVEKLLDVDDNLERTLSAAKTVREGALDSLLQGIDIVLKQFRDRLSELGLQRHDPIGEAFDPTSMDALGVVPVNDPEQDNKVVLTLRAGFRVGDLEVRPALVQVGKFMG